MARSRGQNKNYATSEGEMETAWTRPRTGDGGGQEKDTWTE